MLEQIVFIVLIVIIVWLIGYVVYLQISNRQRSLESEIEEVSDLLGDENAQ